MTTQLEGKLVCVVLDHWGHKASHYGYLVSIEPYSNDQEPASSADMEGRREYREEKRCCIMCDSKKVCHVCGDQTRFACSNCAINFGVTVYVCTKSACRDEHERKCFGDKPPAPVPDMEGAVEVILREWLWAKRRVEGEGRDSQEHFDVMGIREAAQRIAALPALQPLSSQDSDPPGPVDPPDVKKAWNRVG